MSVTIKKEPNYDSINTTTTDTLLQIKQEDIKEAKIVINQLEDIADELAERPDIEIKQEPTSKVENKLQNTRLNQDVYRYCCNMCDEKMLDLRTTIVHMLEVHNIQHRSRYKHMDLEPDVDDPNNFCATCEKSFSTKDSFEYHLKTLHFIVRVRQVLEPEVDDPNFYCRQCDFTYMDQKFYFKHLKSYHGIKVRSLSTKFNANIPKIIKRQQKKNKICCRACGADFSSKKNYAYHTAFVHGISRKTKVDANMVIIPSYEEVYQCRACSGNFNSKQLYLEHLHSTHAMNISEDSQTPNANDPNFYCRVCDATSLSYDGFQTHLLAVHNIGAAASSSSIKVDNDSTPDPNDPNFYCRSCRQNFFFKDSYKKHLLLVHQQGLVPDASSSSLLPDPHDPSFYCSVCQRGWKTLQQYRHHCKVTHKMELGFQRQSFHHATIDPNDPNSHCAQCNRTYANYRQHLRHAHNISIPPQ
ncbi:Eukaryotic translation initiation factor eIF-1 [Mucor velutinosus]|uniref:Eukaryotic translation initiation factor eIF-1 n=1 Tax=Mucor velutinosus TaxID=708070 RepID=A0AAN7DM15_9FUNG|nr:Eukaryotic translation initiation factor eIF-1 [Mucor velutinosus]